MPLFTTPPIRLNAALQAEVLTGAAPTICCTFPLVAGGNFITAAAGVGFFAPSGQIRSDTTNAAVIAQNGTFFAPNGTLQGGETTQNLGAAGTQIAPSNRLFVRLNNTSGGALVLTGTPTIVAPNGGDILRLQNISANAITIQDEAILAGSALRLGGVNIVLAQWDCVDLQFNQTDATWGAVGI